jgi:hypothetical protein
MLPEYKETSRGELAGNVPECCCPGIRPRLERVSEKPDAAAWLMGKV